MAAAVNRFAPVVRGEGKGIIIPMSNWIDSYLAPITTASSYTLPTGTNPSGGGSQSVNPPPGVTVTATILRIWNPGPNVVWINAQATAVIPTAITATGLREIPIYQGTSFMFQVPLGVASISLIAATAAQIVAIESWW